MTAKCKRCGVETYETYYQEQYVTLEREAGHEHTAERCADRCAAQRDEARAEREKRRHAATTVKLMREMGDAAALRAELARKDAALRTLIERHATVVHAFPPKDSRRDAVRADCAEARAALAPAALAPAAPSEQKPCRGCLRPVAISWLDDFGYCMTCQVIRGDRFECRECGCFWRLNSDRSWSLFDAQQKPKACCDNAADFLDKLKPTPTWSGDAPAAPSASEKTACCGQPLGTHRVGCLYYEAPSASERDPGVGCAPCKRKDAAIASVLRRFPTWALDELRALQTSEETAATDGNVAPSLAASTSRPAEAPTEPGSPSGADALSEHMQRSGEYAPYLTQPSAERVAREWWSNNAMEYSPNIERSLTALIQARELAAGTEGELRGWNKAIDVCAARFAESTAWLCLDHGGEEQELIIARILELARPAAPTSGPERGGKP